ncbi:MAG: acetyl-CoA carboxylase biotin carboxylase subunit, partial [Acidimicrobiales bacterium]
AREAAVRLCRETHYDGVGTVELLVEPVGGRIVFLEVNPRLQVEHGVTELVTGLDLVAMQLGIAGGLHLGELMGEVAIRGAAIECRINAEDPDDGFRPSPGRITRFEMPERPGARVDTHCEAGCVVPPFYDSLVANVMTVAPDRSGAIRLMLSVLDAIEVEGIATTKRFQRDVLAGSDFEEGRVWTSWVDELMRGQVVKGAPVG